MVDGVNRALTTLAGWQERHPWRFVVVAVVLGALSIPPVLQLGLKGNFTALLPESKPSVVDFDELAARYGISSNLSIAIHGDDIDEVRKLTFELATDLEAKKPKDVRWLDWNLRPFQDFIGKNKFLYADYKDVKKVRDMIIERIEYEKTKRNPLFMDLGDEPEDPRAFINGLKEKDNKYTTVLNRFPTGLLEHPDKPLTIIFLRTSVQGGQVPQAVALLDDIKARVARLRPDLATSGLRVDYGGDLMDVTVEIQALQREIAIATTATVIMVLLCVYLFFMSFRAIPLLGLTLVPPVLMTFGIAEFTVDFLNTSTAFLGSIVIGNGINPNIIWLARYFERRRSGRDVSSALVSAHTGTWVPTLTASLAAGLAYVALISTDFRGFRDFGTIGGAGMVLCWLGAYLLLPALAVIVDRRKPLAQREGDAHQNIYGTAFAWLALKNPKLTLITTVVLTVISAVVVTKWIADDPLEYDYRNLQSVRDPDNRITWVNKMQGEVGTEAATGSSIAVLAPSRRASEYIRAQLEGQREQFPNMYSEVINLDLLRPEKQSEKIALFKNIREEVHELKPHLSDEDWAEIQSNLPPADLKPITYEQLPKEAIRMFTEMDGTRGRIVFVEPGVDRNTWDGLYLLKWSEAVRNVKNEDGTRLIVSGNAPVFADLLDSVLSDGPQAIFAALVVTIILLLVAFRTALARFLTLAALLFGILWMAAVMALFGMRLNFLNFVAFPITFGNGADYGVNVMKRTTEEIEALGNRTLAAARAIEATGGAVVLNSLTTIIGYISLFVSSNQALNSFGAAMAISEVTCLATAVVALPAMVAWLDSRARAE